MDRRDVSRMLISAPRPSVQGSSSGGVEPNSLAGIAALTVGLLVGALVMLGLAPANVVPSPDPVWWLAVAVAFVASEILVVHLPFRRQSHTFSASEIALLFGLFVLPAEQLVLAHTIGAVVAIGWHRRRGLLKTAFNVGLLTFTTMIAWYVLHVVGPGIEPFGPAVVLAALVAIVSSSLLQAIGVLVAIRASGEDVTPKAVRGSIGIAGVTAVANTCVGLLVATLLHDGRGFAVALAVPPIMVALGASAAYTRNREAAATIGLLYDTARELQTADGLEEIVALLLPWTREQVRAERVELTIFVSEDVPGGRAVSDTGGYSPIQAYDVAGRHEEHLRHALELRGALVLGAREQDDVLKGYARGRGWRDAIAVPLAGSNGVFGCLVVADRLGEMEAFTTDEADLLGSIANTAAATLERNRLGESLDHVMRLQEKLVRLTTTDALTGMQSRDALHREIEAVLAQGGTAALIVLDVDGISDVNAAFGADVGDEMIRTLASRVAAAHRHGDLSARIAGSRFGVLVRDIEDVDLVHEMAASLGRTMQRPVVLGGGEEVVLRCGVGLALDLVGASELLAAGELAAKAGRTKDSGSYVVHHRDLGAGSHRRLQLSRALWDVATSGRGIGVRYQPIIDVASGQVIAVEAFARWSHEFLRDVPPHEFLPIAEHFGLMEVIGQALMAEAFRDAASWQSTSPGLGLSINLSASQIIGPGLLSVLHRQLSEHDLAPGLLTIDLNARDVARSGAGLTSAIAGIKAFGIHLALDGVTGSPGSLDLVPSLEIDVVKIDRSLTSRLQSSNVSRSLVASLVDFAHELHLPALVAGIEESAQLDTIRSMGADHAQGFLVARPLEASAVTALVGSRDTHARSDPGPSRVVHLGRRARP